MTTRAQKRGYGCLTAIRETPDRLGAKMAEMSPEERVQWLSTGELSDPVLRRLATRRRPKRTA